MPTINKTELLAALRARLAEQFERLAAAQQSVQSGAVHSEAKQEHPKDTRAIEAGYLARGLAERAETLRDGIRAIELMRARSFAEDDPAAPGAVVVLTPETGDEATYFLAPAGGGELIQLGAATILVLTPHSPLGAAIAGRREGDEISVELPSGLLRASIDQVF